MQLKIMLRLNAGCSSKPKSKNLPSNFGKRQRAIQNKNS